MAYGMGNIAGMLARSGTQIGQAIGQPIQRFGENIGAGISAGMLTRDKEKAVQEAQDIIKKYSNDPTTLNTYYQQAALRGETELAKVFKNAAEAARSRAEKRVAGMEASRQSADRRAELARTRVEGMGTELEETRQKSSAIKLALSKEDRQSAQAIRDGLLDPKKYTESVLGKSEDPSEYSFSDETIVVDGKATKVQVAVNKNNPDDRKIYPIGETAPTAKETKQTLGQLLEDSGFETDLSTLEGVKQARRFAITDLGNASLAGQLADLEKQMTPFSLQQSLETVRAISPDFEEAEDMLEKTERYRTLDELSDLDVASLTALLERTITSTTENDLKAVAELSRFRSSKDLVQRIKDFTTMTISGELSDETLREYRQIMDAVDELSRRRVLRAADQTIMLGSEREAEAAKKVREMYETEQTEARFL